MNEERIQQLLKIEREAQQIHDAALRDAEQLLMEANQEAENIVDDARKDAYKEAQQLVAAAQTREGSDRILAETEEKIAQLKQLSAGNFDKAVSYVINRTIGKE